MITSISKKIDKFCSGVLKFNSFMTSIIALSLLLIKPIIIMSLIYHIGKFIIVGHF